MIWLKRIGKVLCLILRVLWYLLVIVVYAVCWVACRILFHLLDWAEKFQLKARSLAGFRFLWGGIRVYAERLKKAVCSDWKPIFSDNPSGGEPNGETINVESVSVEPMNAKPERPAAVEPEAVSENNTEAVPENTPEAAPVEESPMAAEPDDRPDESPSAEPPKEESSGETP